MAFSPYEIRLNKCHRLLFLNFNEVIIFKTLKTITSLDLPMAFFFFFDTLLKSHRGKMPQVVYHVFDEVIFNKVITLMETFDVVMVYKFSMFFLFFDIVIFVEVTFSHKKLLLKQANFAGPEVFLINTAKLSKH